MPIPPVNEQLELVRLLKDIYQEVTQVKNATGHLGDELDGTERSILAKAFRGELTYSRPLSIAGDAHD